MKGPSRALTRRHVLGLGLAAASVPWLRTAQAAGTAEAHGISAFGDLRYPADFQHFDYINPAAPKGGLFSLIPSVRSYNQSYQTFNSFNAFVLTSLAPDGSWFTKSHHVFYRLRA